MRCQYFIGANLKKSGAGSLPAPKSHERGTGRPCDYLERDIVIKIPIEPKAWRYKAAQFGSIIPCWISIASVQPAAIIAS